MQDINWDLILNKALEGLHATLNFLWGKVIELWDFAMLYDDYILIALIAWSVVKLIKWCLQDLSVGCMAYMPGYMKPGNKTPYLYKVYAIGKDHNKGKVDARLWMFRKDANWVDEDCLKLYHPDGLHYTATRILLCLTAICGAGTSFFLMVDRGIINFQVPSVSTTSMTAFFAVMTVVFGFAAKAFSKPVPVDYMRS